VIDAGGLHGCDRKAGGDRGQPQSEWKTGRPLPHQYCHNNAGDHQASRGPPSRLTIGCKVSNDAKRKGDRKPSHEPAGGDLCRNPMSKKAAKMLG
jgi:hypothetical protein